MSAPAQSLLILDAAREAVTAAMNNNFALITVAINARIAELMTLRFREEVSKEVDRILKERA